MTGLTSSDDFPIQPKSGVFQSTRPGSDDAFITKLGVNGALVYSTYLGGGNNDNGTDIAIDTAGNAYVTGTTFLDPFPTTLGALQSTRPGKKKKKKRGGGSTRPAPDALSRSWMRRARSSSTPPIWADERRPRQGHCRRMVGTPM